MKILWYMFQPILCKLGVHDWYRTGRGGVRECDYCKRVEVFDHRDENGNIHWRER